MSDYLDLRDTDEILEEGPEHPDYEEARELADAVIRDLSLGGDDGFVELSFNEPTAIAAHAFTDYARELARDIGAVTGGEDWPLRHIDWDAAADELLMDYGEFEYRGTTYYVRYC